MKKSYNRSRIPKRKDYMIPSQVWAFIVIVIIGLIVISRMMETPGFSSIISSIIIILIVYILVMIFFEIFRDVFLGPD